MARPSSSVVGGTTTVAQETAQNAALGNATAENPAVAVNDPTRDVSVSSVTASETASAATIVGDSVEASDETKGFVAQPGSSVHSALDVYGEGIDGSIGAEIEEGAINLVSRKGAEAKKITHEMIAGLVEANPTAEDPLVRASQSSGIPPGTLNDLWAEMADIRFSAQVDNRSPDQDMAVYDLEDTSDIDLANSAGQFDSTNKRWESVIPDTGVTESISFASTSDFSQQDLRGTITYALRTGDSTVIFQTSEGGDDVTVGAGQTNPSVIPGCIATIGGVDFTILSIDEGDNKTCTLDSDPSSGAVSAITALTVDDNNVTLNTYLGPDVTIGECISPFAGLAAGTNICKAQALTNGAYITAIDIWRMGADFTCTLKLAKDNGDGTYDVINIESWPVAGAGLHNLVLTVPYQVPATGTYYAGYYDGASNNVTGYIPGSGSYDYKTGSQLGNNIGSWGTSSTNHLSFKVYQQLLISPTGLHVACTNSETDPNVTYWGVINSAVASCSHPGSSIVGLALCGNPDAADEAYYTIISGTAYKIAQLVSGTWKACDAAGDLQTAAVNEREAAIAEAMASGYANAYMDPTAWAAIADFTDVFVAETTTKLRLAIGFQADGVNIPLLDSVTFDYDTVVDPVNFVCRFDMFELSANDPASGFVLLKIVAGESYTVNTDLFARFTIDNGANWETVTLALQRSYSGTDVIRADFDSITAQGDNEAILEIYAANGKDLALSDAAIRFDYAA